MPSHRMARYGLGTHDKGGGVWGGGRVWRVWLGVCMCVWVGRYAHYM